MEEYKPQKEIARQYRVTTQLVSDLVCESKRKPEKLREKKQRLKEVAEQRSVIIATVKSI